MVALNYHLLMVETANEFRIGKNSANSIITIITDFL